jgi:hypothetical protein
MAFLKKHPNGGGKGSVAKLVLLDDIFIYNGTDSDKSLTTYSG